MPFTKGHRKHGGRTKGVSNKVTTEAKAACNELVDNPNYRAALLRRLVAGTLAPGMEQTLWYYAKGKPTERIELGADKSLSRLIAEATGLVTPDDGTT